MGKEKQIKKWNGGCVYNGKYRGYDVNVAAYSQKQAVDIINAHIECVRLTASDIRTYYSPTWGNDMDGIEPTEPCLYVCLRNERIKLL